MEIEYSRTSTEPNKMKSERDQLLARLKGQRVIIPDLQRTLGHWPFQINPHLPELDVYVHKTLNRLLPPGLLRQRYHATKVAQFASSWWPNADLERLKAATALSLWLFMWDDETDSQEISGLAHDFEQCQLFREETITFVRMCLRNGRNQQPMKTSHFVIQYFEECAKVISRKCSQSELDTFLIELEMFVKMTEVEQRVNLSNRLPTIEEYRSRRAGSSAVGVCLAIAEFCCEIELSSEVRHDPDMHALWVHTNSIISVVNDMLSIKKEIEQRQLDSLIPLLYIRSGEIQFAMDEALQYVQNSVQALDDAEVRLENRYSTQSEQLTSIRTFIEGCKHACTANLAWSLSTGRYKLPASSLDGGLKIIL